MNTRGDNTTTPSASGAAGLFCALERDGSNTFNRRP